VVTSASEGAAQTRRADVLAHRLSGDAAEPRGEQPGPHTDRLRDAGERDGLTAVPVDPVERGGDDVGRRVRRRLDRDRALGVGQEEEGVTFERGGRHAVPAAQLTGEIAAQFVDEATANLPASLAASLQPVQAGRPHGHDDAASEPAADDPVGVQDPGVAVPGLARGDAVSLSPDGLGKLPLERDVELRPPMAVVLDLEARRQDHLLDGEARPVASHHHPPRGPVVELRPGHGSVTPAETVEIGGAPGPVRKRVRARGAGCVRCGALVDR
jgi:hypothetical protein